MAISHNIMCAKPVRGVSNPSHPYMSNPQQRWRLQFGNSAALLSETDLHRVKRKEQDFSIQRVIAFRKTMSLSAPPRMEANFPGCPCLSRRIFIPSHVRKSIFERISSG